MTSAEMSVPLSVSYAQVGFMLTAVALLAVGVRRGNQRLGSIRRVDPDRISTPLIWSGLTVWLVGAGFGLATSIVWLRPLSVVFSSVTLLLAVALMAIFGWIMSLRRKRSSRASAHDD